MHLNKDSLWKLFVEKLASRHSLLQFGIFQTDSCHQRNRHFHYLKINILNK
jgi:hypothetical protein